MSDLPSPVASTMTFDPPLQLGGGFSVRAHFASLAMQGLLSSSSHYPDANGTAERAIRYADALLKALEEKSNG